MSDLISREALLKVIRDDRLTNASDAIYFITNAPAIEQGEVVRKAVEEALEKAAKLLESQRFMALDSTKTYTAEEYRQGLKSSVAFLAKEIRALIKRNAEGVQ